MDEISTFFGGLLLLLIVATWWQYALIGLAVWLILKYVL